MAEKKGFFAEFKTFISRGNVVDMAIGIIIGGLFTAIVNSFVKDILNPILGLLVGGTDFGELKIVLREATLTTEELAIRYGNLIQNIIQFILTALVLFVIVRAINRMKEKAEEEAKKAEEETRRGGADDDALVLGLDLVEDLAEPTPLVLLLDAAGNAHVVHRGHEHQRPARQGDVGGDPGALGAHGVLGHLDQHVLTGLQEVADLPRLRELLQFIVLIPGEEHVPGVQKGVLFQADVHKGRLHARQHVLDLAQIDVPHQPFRPVLLHIELHGGAVLHHRHADGEFVGVYQNFLIHVFLSQGWAIQALRRSTSPPAGI